MIDRKKKKGAPRPTLSRLPIRQVRLAALAPLAAALLAVGAGALLLGGDDHPQPARARAPRPAARAAPRSSSTASRRPTTARASRAGIAPGGSATSVAPPTGAAAVEEPAVETGTLDDGLLPALLLAARSYDPSARRLAAKALGAIHARAGADRLCVAQELEKLLEDRDLDVAAAAARALGQVSTGHRALMRRLAVGEPDGVHLACLESLAAVGTPDEVESLMAWVWAGPALQETTSWAIDRICRRSGVAPPKGLPTPLDNLR